MFKVEVRNASNGDHMSTMQVVDLAGRENEQTSECKGDRFRELRHINRSLFDLASCIHALCDGNRDHVPFRNSKLTMLLSDSLASNSRTTLLATLTPSSAGFDENILTCRFLEQVEPLLGGPDPVILKLDERSFVYYMPAITGDKDPSAWYDELTAVLQNSTLTTPTPPKDPGDCLADSALARSPQVFCMLAARTPRRRMSVPSFMQRVRLITLTLLCTRVAAKKSSKSASSKEVGLHQVPDAGLQAMDFRYNPRWCLAGRPLETLGQSRNLQCILNLKRMVEEEVGKILAMENESLGETKISQDLLQPYFNSILVNFYKDGKAQIKWHADDENCYGPSDNILIGAMTQMDSGSHKSSRVHARFRIVDSRLTVVHGACRQVSSSLQGAEESLSQLEERNHEAAKALQKVGRKLANVEKAIRSVQSRKAGYKGYASGSPDSTATTAGEDRVPGEALRMSLGLALSKRSPRQPKAESSVRVTLISEWRSEAAITSCLELHDGLLAVGFQGCDVNLIDPCTATVSWVLYGHTGRVTALAECADGRFVTGGADGAIRLWAKRT
eukprot:s2218_g1.t2